MSIHSAQDPFVSEDASWDRLVADATPVAVPEAGRPGRPRMTEADVPGPIRELVERALEEGTYFELGLPPEIAGEFAKLVRRYARVRSAGRLSVRFLSSEESRLRFRVRPFAPRLHHIDSTPEMVAQAAPAPLGA